jgi:alpha-L-fucosidase
MKKIVIILVLLASFNNLMAQEDGPLENKEFNRNKPEREEWLRDLGFGMFIHWGIDAQLGIVISHSMVGASDDYNKRFIEELPKTFEPNEFDPYKIAKIAKLAGMKYIVFTAKHHSGFCMWDTKTTDFNIINTPYKKDVLKEYVDAARKAGLAVGLYYSPEDFKFLFDNKVIVNRTDVEKTMEDKTLSKYHELIKEQTKELFSNYGDVDILFIDGAFKEICRKVAWDLQPNLVITRGAVSTPEQHLPGVAYDNLWESCVTMGTQWQYKPTNDEIKSGTKIIELLIETRAKGGNLLLNIGLDPYGKIPNPEERNLTELSAWYFINKEAINNIRPWIVPNEDNIWFTASKDKKTLYAFITHNSDWPLGQRREFVLGSVDTTSKTKISVLGQNDLVVEYAPDIDPKSKFMATEKGLKISVVRAQRIYNNNKWPNPIVVKLENIKPALSPPIVVTKEAKLSDNEIVFAGDILDHGEIKSFKIGFEYRKYGGFFENLYAKEWFATNFVETNGNNTFIAKVGNLVNNTEYEYRAVIIHPRMKIYGEIKRIKTNFD